MKIPLTRAYIMLINLDVFYKYSQTKIIKDKLVWAYMMISLPIRWYLKVVSSFNVQLPSSPLIGGT